MSWDHFTEAEMACRCGCGKCRMSENFMARLGGLRKDVKFQFIVTSGARCTVHNEAVGGAVMSAHLEQSDGAHAVDVSVWGHRVFALVSAACRHGFMGIGLMQDGPLDYRFVHLDDMIGTPGRPRPWIWTYPQKG
jgi:hypothetical protein